MTRIITDDVTGTGNAITVASTEDVIVGPGVLLSSTQASGIFAPDGLNRITVHGAILADLWGARIGDGPEFNMSWLVIGPDATVSSRFEAISTYGEDISVTNAGFVSGQTSVSHIGGDNFSLTNTGQIVGPGPALLAAGDGIRVVNLGSMSSTSTNAVTVEGDGVTIINDGTITANGAAIMTFGAVSIVNSGHLDGALSMIGQGANSYDGSLGTISGVISGGDKADTIQGGHGTEEVRGRGGNDTIAGGAGDDDLFGDNGRDVLRGQAGDDALKGGKGDDRIYGGYGDDALNGGSENDRLVGGQGDDTLTGGSGSDMFVYRWEDGNDVVTDFQNNVDRLDLTAFGFQSVDEVRDYAFDTSSGLLIDPYYTYGTSILLEDFTLNQLSAADLLI